MSNYYNRYNRTGTQRAVISGNSSRYGPHRGHIVTEQVTIEKPDSAHQRLRPIQTGLPVKSYLPKDPGRRERLLAKIREINASAENQGQVSRLPVVDDTNDD